VRQDVHLCFQLGLLLVLCHVHKEAFLPSHCGTRAVLEQNLIATREVQPTRTDPDGWDPDGLVLMMLIIQSV
jgi:hypothetical protein